MEDEKNGNEVVDVSQLSKEEKKKLKMEKKEKMKVEKWYFQLIIWLLGFIIWKKRISFEQENICNYVCIDRV